MPDATDRLVEWYVHLELPLSVLADTFVNTQRKNKEENLYRGPPSMPRLTSWYRIVALSLKHSKQIAYPAFGQIAFFFGVIDFTCQALDQECYNLVPTVFCCKHRACISIGDLEFQSQRSCTWVASL